MKHDILSSLNNQIGWIMGRRRYMNRNNGQKCTYSPPLISFLEVCERYPEKKLFTFLREDGHSDFITGETLIYRTKILSDALQQKVSPQEKILLLLPQGLEYICSLIACLSANAIAIPFPITNSSTSEQIIEKLDLILKDSQASHIISNSYFEEYLKKQPSLSKNSILNFNELIKNGSFINKDLNMRTVAPEDIALLLYTSGSTSQPKGVMISHRNLMSQAFFGATHWEVNQESHIVSWMPQYHSLGINFNIFTPLLKGASSIFLAPDTFIKDPAVWFRTIHQNQATHTAAPNFALDYCCSSIDLTSVQDLSLSSLQAIVSGGEPINKVTYDRFISIFKCLGVKEEVFCPDYGLSEAGSVTAKKPNQPMRFLSLDIPSLEQGKIKRSNREEEGKYIASCGEIGEDIKVLIVNPETCEPCLPGENGEIWIKSPSVGMGYWNRKNETETTFSGIINTTKEEYFLRTGDLGFIEDNHLYIVGRRKEVIIIYGKNHYPVDIEWTIKKFVPSLTLPNAVFSYEVNQQEKVIVVQEVATSLNEKDYEKIAQDIIIAVLEVHGIEVYEVIFVNKGSIPRSGSGKIQRKACQYAYINQKLSIVYQHRNGAKEISIKVQEDVLDVNHNLLEIIKKEIFLPIINIDPKILNESSSFIGFGLDSIQYIRLAKQIEEVLKVQVTPMIFFKNRSFEQLAQYLSTQIREPQTTQSQPIIKTESSKLPYTPNADERDIAIIGMNCNFPGRATEPDNFWDIMFNKRDCIVPISKSRPKILTDYQDCYDSNNDSFPQWGGFIEDVDAFDATFFGISPLEAESMDPQQRKLLELTWSVIEDAGYNPHQMSGKDVGLFVGVHNNDYAELISRNPALIETYGAYLDSGLHMSMIAHRISRWFNFRGPSEVINTACSSSLIAVHHAMESIYRGESSLAIAGGINLILASRIYYASYKAGMLSKDGRCKTFDEQADGFVRSEGYGAVLLKQYSQAIKDGDHIYGVIKGAFINHDGRSNSLRAPNLDAQKQLIKTAYQKTGLPPETISYIEVHGTGTSLGDPIEIQALQEAFQELKPDLPGAFCGLGTVKTNIGHCESAAGIAGLIKVLLSMKYRTLPAILHFKNLNPYVSLQNSPLYSLK